MLERTRIPELVPALRQRMGGTSLCTTGRHRCSRRQSTDKHSTTRRIKRITGRMHRIIPT